MALESVHYFLILVALLTLKDVFLSMNQTTLSEKEESEESGASGVKEGIGLSKLGVGQSPSVTFLYCSSWGYRNAFEQYEKILLERNPMLLIKGDNFPPAAWRTFAAKVVNIVKIVLIGSILLNKFDLLRLVGIPDNTINWVTANKIYACLMGFFVCNFVETQLLSTGAFEIFIDDVQVWSKLRSGRVPSAQEIVHIVEHHLMKSDNVNVHQFDYEGKSYA